MPLAPEGPVVALRTSTLGVLVASESNEWVKFMITLLEGEGRLIEGGWPGTVSEARKRLMACLRKHPQDPPPDSGDVTLLVDMLYSEAQRLWLIERA